VGTEEEGERNYPVTKVYDFITSGASTETKGTAGVRTGPCVAPSRAAEAAAKLFVE
jgi:hypothetical protein